MRSECITGLVLALGIHALLLFAWRPSAVSARSSAACPKRVEVEVRLLAATPAIRETTTLPDVTPQTQPSQSSTPLADLPPSPPVIPDSSSQKESIAPEIKSSTETAPNTQVTNANSFREPSATPIPNQTRNDDSPAITNRVAMEMEGNYLVLSHPSYLKRGRAEYPQLARQKHQEGTVCLAVYLNACGGIDKIEVKESSGFPLLDQAAVAAELKSRFRPAYLENKPAPSKVEVPYRFLLEK